MFVSGCSDKSDGIFLPEVPDTEEPEAPEEPQKPREFRNVPLLIVAGQSNADGEAPVNTAPSWLSDNDYKVDNYLMWNIHSRSFPTFQLGVNAGSEYYANSSFSFDPFFAKLYLEKYGDELFCIRQTLGGIPISEKGDGQQARWTAHINLIPAGERSMVNEIIWKLTEAKEYAEQNSLRLVPVAILFHQGESDTWPVERRNDYETNLTDLKEYLRKLLDVEDLPFICGEIFYRDYACNTINDVFHKISQTDENFRCINMSQNQTYIGDRLHYDGAALEFMGTDMFRCYEEIIAARQSE